MPPIKTKNMTHRYNKDLIGRPIHKMGLRECDADRRKPDDKQKTECSLAFGAPPAAGWERSEARKIFSREGCAEALPHCTRTDVGRQLSTRDSSTTYPITGFKGTSNVERPLKIGSGGGALAAGSLSRGGSIMDETTDGVSTGQTALLIEKWCNKHRCSRSDFSCDRERKADEGWRQSLSSDLVLCLNCYEEREGYPLGVQKGVNHAGSRELYSDDLCYDGNREYACRLDRLLEISKNHANHTVTTPPEPLETGVTGGGSVIGSVMCHKVGVKPKIQPTNEAIMPNVNVAGKGQSWKNDRPATPANFELGLTREWKEVRKPNTGDYGKGEARMKHSSFSRTSEYGATRAVPHCSVRRVGYDGKRIPSNREARIQKSTTLGAAFMESTEVTLVDLEVVPLHSREEVGLAEATDFMLGAMCRPPSPKPSLASLGISSGASGTQTVDLGIPGGAPPTGTRSVQGAAKHKGGGRFFTDSEPRPTRAGNQRESKRGGKPGPAQPPKACFKCSKMGHLRADCPEPDASGRGGSEESDASVCQEASPLKSDPWLSELYDEAVADRNVAKCRVLRPIMQLRAQGDSCLASFDFDGADACYREADEHMRVGGIPTKPGNVAALAKAPEPVFTPSWVMPAPAVKPPSASLYSRGGSLLGGLFRSVSLPSSMVPTMAVVLIPAVLLGSLISGSATTRPPPAAAVPSPPDVAPSPSVESEVEDEAPAWEGPARAPVRAPVGSPLGASEEGCLDGGEDGFSPEPVRDDEDVVFGSEDPYASCRLPPAVVAPDVDMPEFDWDSFHAEQVGGRAKRAPEPEIGHVDRVEEVEEEQVDPPEEDPVEEVYVAPLLRMGLVGLWADRNADESMSRFVYRHCLSMGYRIPLVGGLFQSAFLSEHVDRLGIDSTAAGYTQDARVGISDSSSYKKHGSITCMHAGFTGITQAYVYPLLAQRALLSKLSSGAVTPLTYQYIMANALTMLKEENLIDYVEVRVLVDTVKFVVQSLARVSDVTAMERLSFRTPGVPEGLPPSRRMS